MAANQTRDPEEIEREIRRTQDDMSQTVDQLGSELTPRNLLNALLDKAGENDVDARYLLDGARRNPLALGLIAAGVIWLASDSDARVSTLKPDRSGKKNADSGWDYDDDYHRGYVDHMSRVEARDGEDPTAYQRRRDHARASYLMIERGHDEDEKTFRQRLDEATHRVRERRDSMKERMRRGGSHASDQASAWAEKGRSAYQDNPLIGGLAAALAGAFAATALPVSRMEEEQLGSLGSSALDQTRQGKQALEQKAREKKDEVVDRADDRLNRDQSSGGTPVTGPL